MKTKRKSPFAIYAPLLLHDPMTGESKISTNRWSSFLFDIRGESNNFKEVLDRASYDHSQANKAYKKSEQLSFNAIHNVKRRPPPPDHMIPRVPHPKPVEEREPQYAPFEFDTAPSNHDRWPKRATSAVRFLNPNKLQSIYSVEKRKKDTIVLSGDHLEGNEAF